MKQFKQYALLGLMLTCASMANAGLIRYAGDLTDGVTRAGEVANDSIRSMNDYQYWSFRANPGDLITLVARRSEYNHDPVLRIWEGLFGDTAELGRARYVADDEIATPGPFGDPQEIFRAAAAVYTVGVYDHSAGRSICYGPCNYRISLSGSTLSVAEPAGLLLLGAALLGVALRRRLSLWPDAHR